MPAPTRDRMTDIAQLPFVLKLVADDSPTTQAAVDTALAAIGPPVREAVAGSDDLTDDLRADLHARLREARREWFREAWSGKRGPNAQPDTPATAKDRLQRGLVIISEYLSGMRRHGDVIALLDGLAGEYTRSRGGLAPDPESLAEFLFTQRMTGGAEAEYRSGDGSDLLYVLTEGRGLPIALCSIFILVGDRLGLDIRGLNFPGHFLALAWRVDGTPILVDCHSHGSSLDEDDYARMPLPKPRPPFSQLIGLEASTTQILLRTLRNLAHAAQMRDDDTEVDFLVGMLDDTAGIAGVTLDPDAADPTPAEAAPFIRPPRRPPEEAGPVVAAEPQFDVGSRVVHRRYGYRGIVVARDLRCEADELWYRSNTSQPRRDQPWYHVLVHESPNVTYAAQSSLSGDPEAGPVQHPLLDAFFFDIDGTYVRNERPWPPAAQDPPGEAGADGPELDFGSGDDDG
jgi:heat shock protein HspQ